MFRTISPLKTVSNLLTPSTSNSPSTTTTSLSSSSSTTTSSLENSSHADPQVGALFSFKPKLLEPFMGLKDVAHKDDPWNYKAYDLYQPIFTGGGTFEEYLKEGRYKRDTSRSTSDLYTNRNVLTPEMLERLLRIKMNFEKNYPLIYKAMMGHTNGDKSTSESVTPPEIPLHVSYPNLELAAAEINQLKTLMQSYQQEQQKILELMQKQKEQQQQQQPQTFQPLTDFPKEELSFGQSPSKGEEQQNYASNQERTQEWETSNQEPVNNKSNPDKESPLNSEAFNEDETNFWKYLQETTYPHKEEQSFWENPQETLKTLSEQEQQHFLAAPPQETLTAINEEENFFENRRESLKALKEQQQETSPNEEPTFWENTQKTLNTLSEQAQQHFSETPTQETLTSPHEEHSFWQNPEETLKALSEHQQQHFLETPPPQQTLPSLNEDQKFWENPEAPLLEPNSSLQKRNSFWADLEAADEKDHQASEDSDRIFNFDEDFD